MPARRPAKRAPAPKAKRAPARKKRGVPTGYGFFLGLVAVVLLIVGVWVWLSDDDGPSSGGGSEGEGRTVELLTTGYCNCEKCCSWTRNAAGEAVYAYGKLKGKPKSVGRTSSGTTARHGTIAADLTLFPYGTRIEVPGYGTGTVEDIGGMIKDEHIDLWFPTHEEAKRWGRRTLKVCVMK